ncbi:MAG TPA: hypothetical protein VL994_09810 [Steroidobacteraceae bacterium]|nr:hypothetical protein [Steroidobacteraceae bacterium]
MRVTGFLASLLITLPATAAAPAAAGGAEKATPQSQVRRELEQRRDTFLHRIAAEGYHPCAAPQITLADTPSFGNYRAERNEIVVASWQTLTSEERQDFAQMAKQIGGRATAVSVFEGGTYRWVFMHELGHWWQSCVKQTRPNSYEEENGANRIALAFWREQDPQFAAGIVHGFEALVHAVPSPVPPGSTPQQYLDAHFAELAKGDTYTWFQAESIATLAHEEPPPSLHKALSQPLYPW